MSLPKFYRETTRRAEHSALLAEGKIPYEVDIEKDPKNHGLAMTCKISILASLSISS